MDNENAWDKLYSEGKHLNQYPMSDLISLYYRYVHQKVGNKQINVLEIGPGIGNNLSFLLNLDINYFSVENSLVAHKIMMSKFPNLKKEHNIVAKFHESKFQNGTFDLIIDRAGLTHCNNKELESSCILIKSLLKKDGFAVIMDWFADDHPDSNKGDKIDSNTRGFIPEGQFQGIDQVHFFKSNEILKYFKDMRCELFQKKIITNAITEDIQNSTFNLVYKNE